MNRMMTLLLALGVSKGALAGPEFQADIQAYHAAAMQAYRSAAVQQIRDELLQDLARTQWSRPLDLQLREVTVAAQQDTAAATLGGPARLHLAP